MADHDDGLVKEHRRDGAAGVLHPARSEIIVPGALDKGLQGELRAGAGDALVRTIADLWSGLNSIRWATPSSTSDALAE